MKVIISSIDGKKCQKIHMAKGIKGDLNCLFGLVSLKDIFRVVSCEVLS